MKNIINLKDIQESNYKPDYFDVKILTSNKISEKIYQDLIDPEVDIEYSLGFDKVAEDFMCRKNELTIIAGQNGSGKSLFSNQVSLSLLKQKQRSLIISLEMPVKNNLLRFYRQFSGKNIYKLSSFEQRKIISEFDDFSQDNLFFFDFVGNINIALIYKLLHYAKNKLKIDFFIIDSLMKFDISEDDYNQQKAIINVLSSLAKDLNIHIFLIHHVRKPNSQNTYSVPTKYDLKGTSAISDLSDNVPVSYTHLTLPTIYSV